MSSIPNHQNLSNESEVSALLVDTVASPSEPEMERKKYPSIGREIRVDILAALFGISAWLSINALFTQMPILVQSAPEGWNLPSYLSVLIQCANIGPVLYSISQKYCPRLVPDKMLIYFILLLGTAAVILMAFFYDVIWVIADKKYSAVLFALTFCIALLGCSSSVLFFPFMNNFPEVYLVSFMVGEGFSGLVPSMIALAQGVNGKPTCVNTTDEHGDIIIVPQRPPPRFSSGLYFFLIFAIMAVSSVSFFLLNNLPACKKHKLVRNENPDNEPVDDMYVEPNSYVPSDSTSPTLSPLMARILLVCTTILSMFSNGVLPSAQSYSCLPYGNMAYHLAVNIGNMANPIACFLMFFIPHTPPKTIFSLFILATLTIVYALTTASLSPHPPLKDTTIGIVVIIINWVACHGLISFIKMSIAAVFRREGGKGLFWFGAFTQLGAAIGSGVMFYLLNFLHIFTSYKPCQ